MTPRPGDYGSRAYGPGSEDAYGRGFEDSDRLGAPAPLAGALGAFVARRRWHRRLADARVHARWGEIAGDQLAAHVEPVRLAGGVLVVQVASAAWATQLRYLSADLVRRANDVLGDGSVTQVRIVTAGEEQRPRRRDGRPEKGG